MKKNKIFSFGLYLEGIRQLRVIGIIFSIFYALEAILIPIGRVISINALTDEDRYVRVVTGISVHPILMVTFIIVAPIMTLQLFGFLNKRRSSDFYHAVPHSRISLFLSFFAAIITWIAFIILSTGLLSIIVNLIFAQYFTIVINSFIMLMLFSFITSLLVISATLIAMSISGNLLNNVVVTSLILFFPRFISAVISITVCSNTPVLMSKDISNSLNLIINFFVGFLEANSFSQIIYNVPSLIYTAVLAAVYAVIACILFKVRKSEAAAHSSPNRFLQAAYRIILTMTICSVICASIFIDGIDDPESLFIYVVFYVIAVIIYFLYELLTTRKLKNLVRAIPGLLVVVALNIALLISFNVFSNVALSFQPSADQIKSVSLVNDTYHSYDLSFGEYINLLSSSYEIKDKQVRKLVSESLSDCINTLQTHKDLYYDKYYYLDKYQTLNVKIKTSTATKYRCINIPSDKINIISEALGNNASYKELFTSLPSPVKNTMSSNISLTNTQLEELFNCMQQELKEVDFDKWYTVVISDSTDVIDYLRYSTLINHEEYYIYIPLSLSATPKTCEKYYQLLFEKNDEAKDMLSQLKEAENYGMYLDIYIYDEASKAYQNFYYSSDYDVSSPNNNDIADFIVQNIADRPVSGNSSYVNISLQIYDEYYSPVSSIDTICALKDINPDDMPEELAVYLLD